VLNRFNGFYITVLVLITTGLLVSCAGNRVDPFVVDEQSVDLQKSGEQKFAAWNPDQFSKNTGGSNTAVKALLKQADVFISYHALDQASDKLERLLRIEPVYAPAWSRLSWIALQSNLPGRAKQMAQRSNSYAQNHKDLMILNWSFIRQAGLVINNPEEVRRAEDMIQQLEGS